MFATGLLCALAAVAAPVEGLRWLEDPDDTAVAAWRDDHSERALDWLGRDRVEELVTELLAARDVKREGLVAVDHRGGTTHWLRYVVEDLSEEELAARDEDDTRRTRMRSTLLVQSPGAPAPGEPVVVEGVDDTWSLCARDQSPDGRRLVWSMAPRVAHPSKFKAHRRSCRTWVRDLDTGQTTFLGEQLQPSARFSPDGERLLLVQRRDHGRRSTVTEVEGATGTVLAATGHGRGRVSASWMPDGTQLVWEQRNKRTRIRWGDERLALPRRSFSWVGLHDGRLLLLDKDKEGRRRVVAVDPDNPRVSAWEELLVDNETQVFRSVKLHRGTFLLSIYEDGAVRWFEQPLGSEDRTEVFDLTFSSIGASRTFDSHTLIRAGLPQGARTWLRGPDGVYEELVGPRYDADVVFETAHTTSLDGTEVPLSLVKPANVSAPAPAWIDVYGGFGHDASAQSSGARELFLARGGVLVTVHARGGSERGEAWHEAAQGENLGKTYEDVHAAAHWLVEEGVTEPGRIAISGYSNGGLTAVATMLREPSLFGAVIPQAGVHDLLRGPQMGRWWSDEYGSPRQAAQREVLAAISPVHAEPEEVPPILILTGLTDPTVTPSHSLKLAQAWSEVEGGPVLLRAWPWPSHLHHLPDAERTEALLALPENASERTDAEILAFLERALDLPEAPQSTDTTADKGVSP